jgi:hypothetical protein
LRLPASKLQESVASAGWARTPNRKWVIEVERSTGCLAS